MNKKSIFLLNTLFFLLSLLSFEVVYLYKTKSLDGNSLAIKREFVTTLLLPDLAISTEASYIRHRSLSDFSSIYRDDASLREYFASTYVYKANDAK
ncbi:hypothetical protein [Sulfurimonas denitrificans]|uniref:hypothetical protein n=1 Tax=Sulfurimonas denitrificans TaxID=39766 RepID=UPI00031BF372|nr:hypothetical protein [Sulfurimonas denitrificans]MDD3441779.1 hypothetical protein [Sulfurimonas denitrificans]